MDLDEWEILPRDGFIDYHHEEEEEQEEGERRFFSISSPRSVFKMNHFTYPSPPPPRTRSPRLLPNQQLVPVEIQLEPKIGKDPEAELIKEVTKVPTDTSIVPSATTEKVKDSDLDVVAQVFFMKLKENKFVDMKTYSPKASPRGVLPQIDAGSFNVEDRSETMESVTSPRKEVENDMGMMDKKSEIDGDNGEDVNWEENGNGGLNIWKWSLNGIGAICSFGVVAATFCVIILGSHQRNKQQGQNQKISFQIYTTDDKRIKQVVHHATKWNEAMSAVRGVPLNRAQITTGGYYDGF
ncbi:hypothetical protein HS088_TW04G01136 [Tripterygium wilfordii]|uniref:DUF6821 domain-containing protein n=1 Tax=Tripterygium wilfordii TaxID=458696 RepID=A0A7J7DSA3_TRIWF|nr:uncharacterized protein LOC119995864 [Tripterygium wilfordii]KAF5749173.1 hypothetical protein HS088_TW04G01136 [Tripterygium wilfordii]